MKNPRPPSAQHSAPPPRHPPPSTSASDAPAVPPPSQKPPPPPATSSSPHKPPQSKKTKSRWDSPSKARPSNPSSNLKGGPASASPSTSAIQRDQRPPTAAAAAAPPPSFHPQTFPIPDPAAVSLPPPPPPYGFQNLDRRTIVLVDGTVRTYFALPPEEPLPDSFDPDRHFPPHMPPPPPPHLNQFGREGFHEPPFGNRPPGYFPPFDGPSSGKRKYSEEDELARQRMHVLQYGNPNMLPSGERDQYLGHDEREIPRGPKHARVSGHGYDDLHRNRKSQPDDVDRQAVKKAFLKFVKMIFEDADLKKRYLDTRKNGPPLHCTACGRFVISYYKP